MFQLFSRLSAQEGIVITPARAREIATALTQAADQKDQMDADRAQARVAIQSALRTISDNLAAL